MFMRRVIGDRMTRLHRVMHSIGWEWPSTAFVSVCVTFKEGALPFDGRFVTLSKPAYVV